jgi:hypothetical protein
MATSPYDLTTIASVMNLMQTEQQNYSAAEQAEIQALITDASRYILKRTGRATLNSVMAFTDILDGSGSLQQYVRSGPIIQVFSVYINGNQLIASPNGTTYGYVIDSDRESITIVGAGQGLPGNAAFFRGGTYAMYPTFGGGFKFWQGKQNVSISYLGGYDTDRNYLDTVPASPFQITVFGNLTFAVDLGVRYALTGVNLEAVESSPAEGQYTVADGVYTFSAADTNEQVVISYAYSGVPQDIGMAATRLVVQNYKRRKTVDEKSKIQQSAGTVAYRDWAVDPLTEQTINNYKRIALMVT